MLSHMKQPLELKMMDEGRYNSDLAKILAQELKSSKILKLDYVTDTSQDNHVLYYMK